MKDILFLQPAFKEMIWGGNRLKTDFGYDVTGNQIGECWAVSAHPNGDCEIRNGAFKGKHLSELWNENKELFGNTGGKVFPLLIKIIDAKEDLSIQVHPDDTYAKLHENGSLGKTECWYILDCDEDAKIVIGHHAKNKEELKSMIEDGRWSELIRVLPIKRGDFFQIEPGTVHAIKAGTLILETQQNSDITYRLYDYGRLQNGKPRELHIDKSIDVITCPHKDGSTSKNVITYENAIKEELVSCKYYEACKLSIHGKQQFNQDKAFIIISVLEGNGSIDGYNLSKGDHFIIPYGYGEYELTGDMMLITSWANEG